MHDCAYRYGFTEAAFNFQTLWKGRQRPANRDDTLEADIVVHEMTHGITNPMTGGETGRSEWSEQKSATGITDYDYVTNYKNGIRTHPYSTSTTTNPPRYSSIRTLNKVHTLVGAHGFSTTAKTNPDGTQGNVMFLHLFLDALCLQPCNPTFVTARDAWIQADQNRYDSANKCLL
ncbi:hypothetical protein K443DRAFT_132713 [Laccaria amethystina LaAM-08-1]|uniref:Extracellular metalloproteinase n=1 Tax=Laccaria amethystina LaAM-08-1 TaxID=1095629 RepID=A0A0C9XF62_9AGAR|nr:hypothetical protein K443DRAFT_132713 [Laccaria amethystina LaAM-08-1]